MRVIAVALALACSSSTKVPPTFLSVDAPSQVAASADGTYTWHLEIDYQATNDYATGMLITFTIAGTSTTQTTSFQPDSLFQQIDVGPIAASYKGQTFSYSFVLIDGSGYQSPPSTGMVEFE